MGQQFIRQPNGKWAIWSSIVDDFIYLDCDPWDLFAAQAMEEVRRQYESCRREIDKLLEPKSARRITQKTWEEALERRREIHGGRKPESPFDDVEREERVGKAPPINCIEDYFYFKLEELLAFYWWYHDYMKEQGYKEPPDHFAEKFRQERMLEHYGWLHRMFGKGKMTNPLCPECKEIVEKEGQLCERCRKEGPL